MPTLRALECLVAVIDEGSVTTAAGRLHASQPAVSHQLATLEKELGVALVQRLPRGVLPTAAGRAVYDDAVAALDAAARVKQTGRRIAAGREGSLRIGSAASVLLTVLPPTLRRWHARHPRVQLSVVEADSADVLAAELDAGRIDVAVSPHPTAHTGPCTLIGTEEIVVAMAKDHDLATGTQPLRWADLAGRPAVLYAAGHGLGHNIDALLAAHDIAVTPVLRTRQTGGAAVLAASGLGLAFVPAGAVPSGFGGVLRSLDPPPVRDIVAFTVGDADTLAARFVADLAARGIPLSAPARHVVQTGT